ncbi:N-formylglutamate amidohydrolase [Sphingopyxis sp.]|uniref:N-formylglutamate amidohydrolase n=1 Tax=Sphingopyxis sp. TaxID=1908224 RepID=UPI00261D8684|nr:N-formylglutamate amidohydrolase [Sphingopyxis sp.]MCW0197755.1 N-formylglutamate amidohydrolase [Sphingopyxis sp.]
MDNLTAPNLSDWPDPVEWINPSGRSPIILLCEHASNHIPACYDGLGLGQADLDRHIAWDIGAAAVTRRLAALLDATAILGTYSRLLIDLNRPPDGDGSIVALSEDTPIPANGDLDGAERALRQARIFMPYQDAIGGLVDARIAAGSPVVLIAIHSFNPTFLNQVRPWHAGILFGRAAALGERLVARLAADPALHIGVNQPYSVSRQEDYAILVHGDDRDIPAVLIEIRNDGLADSAQIDAWARRVAAILAPEAAAP